MVTAPLKQCVDCERRLLLEEFYNQKSSRDGKQRYCKECHDLRNRRTHQLKRKFLVEYLSQKGCSECPEKDPVTLEFDHVSGSKLLCVSTMISAGFSLKRIKEEIEKCVVRCANCHRRKTAKEQGWYDFYALAAPTPPRHGLRAQRPGLSRVVVYQQVHKAKKIRAARTKLGMRT